MAMVGNGPAILTVEQAAELLQVRPKTVRALASGGLIPAAKLGKFWRFDEQLLREWLVRRSRENERPALTTNVPSLLGNAAAAGSLSDHLDRLLASLPEPALPASRVRRGRPK
jgi:excisionase family DNA binding protein